MEPPTSCDDEQNSILHKIIRIIFFVSTFSWSFNRFEEYATEGAPAEKIVMRILPLMITAAYLVLGKYRPRLKNLLRPVFWPVLAYLFFGVFFGLFGIQPLLSMWKGAELLIATAFIACTCDDLPSLKREFHAYSFYIELLMYATVVLALISPERGFLDSPSFVPWIRGYLPMLNPNTVGFLAAVALTRLLFTPVKLKPLRLALISGVLLCAQSRTQYAAMVVVFIVFVVDAFRTRQRRRVFWSMIGGAVALLFLFGFSDLVIKVFQRGQSADTMSRLSGRTDYWAIAWAHAGLTGGGFATGSRSLIFEASGVFQQGAVNLHSTYLEAILGAGFLGAIPFLFNILWNVIRQGMRFLLRCRSFDGMFTAFALLLLARTIMSNGPSLFTIDYCLLIMIWFAISITSKEVQNQTEPPKPRVRTELELGGKIQ